MLQNEKRRSQRKEVTLRAAVTRDNGGWSGSDVSVRTLNLSRTGALIESPELLSPGQICTFTVSKPNGGYGDIPARIVWAERSPNKAFLAGVAFRNLSAEEEYLVDLILVRSGQ